MKKPLRSRNLYKMGMLETFCIIALGEYEVNAFLTDRTLVFDNMSYLFRMQR